MRLYALVPLITTTGPGLLMHVIPLDWPQKVVEETGSKIYVNADLEAPPKVVRLWTCRNGRASP